MLGSIYHIWLRITVKLGSWHEHFAIYTYIVVASLCHPIRAGRQIVFPCESCLSGCPSQNLVNATPPKLSRIFLKLCRCFCQGLKICTAFGCNPQINFCHFFLSSN